MARANNERDVANYRIGERNSIEVRPIPHMLWFSEEWRGGGLVAIAEVITA